MSNIKPRMPEGVVPEGATHFYYDLARPGRPSTSPWRKKENGKWFMFEDSLGHWKGISGTRQHLFHAISDAVAPWSGEGYPAIGEQVEFNLGGDKWVPVTIFAIKPNVDESSDILFDHAEGWGISHNGDRLRPHVTPEEQERRKRSAYCDRIYGVIMKADALGARLKNRSDIVEALYDAGLRFHGDEL